MYTLINELCILAGEYPATLLAAEPCDYMRNRTDGVEAGDTANEADATAAAIAKLSEIQEMLRIPRDATQSQAAPENHVAASNIVLKQVAVKLGLFSVIANFMESPILDVGQQASFTCLTLTLLSAEIAEKATPVMPGILKFITAEIDVAIASRKWCECLCHTSNMYRTSTFEHVPTISTAILHSCSAFPPQLYSST